MIAAAAPGLQPLTLLAGFTYYSLLGTYLDTALLLLFTAHRNKRLLADLISPYIDPHLIRNQLLLLPGFLLGFVFLQICRFLLGLNAPAASETETRKWKTTPVKPLLIPCTTTHRRTFPEKHAFVYSYLVVGIPVGWRGNYAGMVSCDVDEAGWLSWFSLAPRTAGRGWFHVDPADYLERGNGQLGLRGKLDAYLTSQVRRPSTQPGLSRISLEQNVLHENEHKTHISHDRARIQRSIPTHTSSPQPGSWGTTSTPCPFGTSTPGTRS